MIYLHFPDERTKFKHLAQGHRTSAGQSFGMNSCQYNYNTLSTFHVASGDPKVMCSWWSKVNDDYMQVNKQDEVKNYIASLCIWFATILIFFLYLHSKD